MLSVSSIMLRALEYKIVIPAFNVPYPGVMEPIVEALRDTESFGLIEVARPEWEKFGAKSLEVIREVYEQCKDERFTRVHLDHTPVIDEDNKSVDYLEIIRRAISVGYDSVMVDGSRLSLEENIAATRSVVDIAHDAGIPVEAELGAVVGHEEGPRPLMKNSMHQDRDSRIPVKRQDSCGKPVLIGCRWHLEMFTGQSRRQNAVRRK